MNFLQLDRTVFLLISDKLTLINRDTVLSGHVKIYRNLLSKHHTMGHHWGRSWRVKFSCLIPPHRPDPHLNRPMVKLLNSISSWTTLISSPCTCDAKSTRRWDQSCSRWLYQTCEGIHFFITATWSFTVVNLCFCTNFFSLSWEMNSWIIFSWLIQWSINQSELSTEHSSHTSISPETVAYV